MACSQGYERCAMCDAITPQFNVGDAVRVKGNAVKHVSGMYQKPGWVVPELFFGKRLRVKDVSVRGRVDYELDSENFDEDYAGHLEPWNDAEEWNGSAWVKKIKRYPFTEAYQMMKAGKWMKRVNRGNCVFNRMTINCDGLLVTTDGKWNHITPEAQTAFSMEQLDAQWEEVTMTDWKTATCEGCRYTVA